MPLSIIFPLYRGRQFYWWRKTEYPEKTTDLLQITDKMRFEIYIYNKPDNLDSLYSPSDMPIIQTQSGLILLYHTELPIVTILSKSECNCLVWKGKKGEAFLAQPWQIDINLPLKKSLFKSSHVKFKNFSFSLWIGIISA